MERTYSATLLAVIAGILLAFAHPPFFSSYFLSLGLFALLGAFYLGDASKKRIFLLGSIAGTIYFGIVLQWVWSAELVSAVNISSKYIGLLILLPIWLSNAVLLGMTFGLFGLIAKRTLSSKNLFFTSLFIGSTFALVQYFQAWFYGIFWFGSGQLSGVHWTMGNFAYSLSTNSIAILLASYVGIYGVVLFFVSLTSLSFLYLLSNRNKKGIIVALVILAVAFVFPVLIPLQEKGGDNKIQYAIIQTSTPTKYEYSTEESLAKFNDQLEDLIQISQKHPDTDIVVFPETSEFLPNLSSFIGGDSAEKFFGDLFSKSTIIVSGFRHKENDGTYRSRVFIIDSKEGIVGSYDKRLLTPGGEYLPSVVRFFVDLISSDTENRFQIARNYNVGEQNIATVNTAAFSVAPIVCSENLSPTLTRQSTRGADVITALNSISFLGGSNAAATQIMVAAQFRAAETGKPLISAINMGQSYAISSRGNIVNKAENTGRDLLTGSLVIRGGNTWYNTVGDWPVLIFIAIILAFYLIKRNNEHKT